MALVQWYCNFIAYVIFLLVYSYFSKYFLAHGLDGAGPEHSSCRIERFLQSCVGDINTPDIVQRKVNMYVLHPTTPANYFHALRRQMHRKFRKPLIIASPKILLRHQDAVSKLSDMGGNSEFMPVLPDSFVPPSSTVKRVILVSGKFYYELAEKRAQLKLQNDVALIRIEELCPFPFGALEDALKPYFASGNMPEVVWAQEEHENQGAYTFVLPRIQKLLDTMFGKNKVPVNYVGRKSAGVSAVGIAKLHKQEYAELMEKAFAGLKN